jgi:hypothetical protein
MKLCNFTRNAAAFAVASLFLARPMLALNNRSWVSTLGSDQNNCTILDPCKTFQHAHDMSVAGGEVDVLVPGEYGPLTISKPITIDGGNKGYILGPDFGLAIQVKAPVDSRVVLRNLSMTQVQPTPSLGIYWAAGQVLFLEHLSINGFSQGILTAVASPSADFPTPPRMFLNDVILRDCSVVAITANPVVLSSTNVHPTNVEFLLDHLVIENAGFGVVMSSGKAQIVHSIMSAAEFAVLADSFFNQVSEINVEDTSISYAKVALRTVGGVIRIAGNNIHDNDTALSIMGGQIVSFGNNRLLGNGGGETPSSTVALK